MRDDCKDLIAFVIQATLNRLCSGDLTRSEAARGMRAVKACLESDFQNASAMEELNRFIAELSLHIPTISGERRHLH